MQIAKLLSLGVRAAGLAVGLAALGMGTAAGQSFIGGFNTVDAVASTVPANGDVNPYGIVRVPVTKGALVAGRMLISNFNSSANTQGTGTTIVQIAPDGAFSLFAQIDPNAVNCPGGVGLTTALAALRSGWVIVGSLPTVDGTAATIGSGCLIVLNASGHVVETITGYGINGPWDMTVADGDDSATLFVTNVLNGTVQAKGRVVKKGTVIRLTLSTEDGLPQVTSAVVVGSGFGERTDPAALVIGPTGVAFDPGSGTLYVADSLANRVAAIPDALTRSKSAATGTTVSQNGALNDPLGLTLAPNGNVLTVNGNDGNMVETDPATGQQVAAKLVDSSGAPPGAGALFGLVAVANGVYFVDDATNTLDLLH